MSDREMRAAFQLTDEGLAAWLYGLVDTLLAGDTLQPEEGDTPHDLTLKGKGRAYRDRAMAMLERLSGWDDATRDAEGRIRWPSQNALSGALVQAMTDGLDIADYAAPRYVRWDEDDPRAEALADEIKANPALTEIAEAFNDLHRSDPEDEEGDG